MPLITSIKLQKEKKRFDVFIDGKFAFVLSAEILVRAGIKVGSEITPNRIQELKKENEIQKVLDSVLNFLSFRPRSKKEILDFLKKKRVGEQEVNIVIQKLEEIKTFDDFEFAKWWMEQRQTFRPKGKRVLWLELKQKGLSDEIINQALEIFPKESEEELAKKILQKKAKQLQGLSRQDFFKKASGFLLRRGFSWRAIHKVIKESPKL